MLLRRNAKCYEEKSYHYQIYHCLKVKPSFHEKLFQKEKNKLLWIYARWLSSHLWFNGRWKLPVAGLNWNLWTQKHTHTHTHTHTYTPNIQRKTTLEKVSMKTSDTPFFKTIPLICQPLPSYGKNLKPSFLSKNLNGRNTFRRYHWHRKNRVVMAFILGFHFTFWSMSEIIYHCFFNLYDCTSFKFT